MSLFAYYNYSGRSENINKLDLKSKHLKMLLNELKKIDKIMKF